MTDKFLKVVGYFFGVLGIIVLYHLHKWMGTDDFNWRPSFILLEWLFGG